MKSFRVFIVAMLVCLAGLVQLSYAAQFPAKLDMVSPRNTDYTAFLGEAVNDSVGHAVAIGDIDGDGRDDAVFSTYLSDGGRGAVYVRFGADDFFDSGTYDISNSSAFMKISGIKDVDWTGYSLAVGNVNGDACDDIIIGTLKGDTPNGINTGIVYVVFGNTGYTPSSSVSITSSSVVTIYGGVQAGDDLNRFGQSIAVGDFDSNGRDDIIIGAPGVDLAGKANAGTAYVVFGPLSAGSTVNLATPPANVMTIKGAAADDRTGCAVASGDFNADGYDEIVVAATGAFGTKGAVYLLNGYADVDTLGTVDLVTPPDKTLIYRGGEEGARIGTALAVGNVNNNIYPDLLISSVVRDNMRGEVYGIAGGPDLIKTRTVDLEEPDLGEFWIYGDDQGEMIGHSLAVADLNQDGFGEVVMGSPSASDLILGYPRTVAGRVSAIWSDNTFFSGREFDLNDDPDSVTVFIGPEESSRLGYSLAMGDFDGDNVDDILMGAPGLNTDSVSGAGEIFAVRGQASTTITTKYPEEGSFVLPDSTVIMWLSSDIQTLAATATDLTTSSLVPGVKDLELNYATYVPDDPWLLGHTYRIDVNGVNACGEPFGPISWEFGIKTDDRVPTMLSIFPDSTCTNALEDTDIVINFSSDAHQDSTKVTVTGASARTISMSKAWVDSTLTLSLANADTFALDEHITVNVYTADQYGDNAYYQWSFDIQEETTPPKISFVTPGNPNKLSNTAPISVIFSADVEKDSVDVYLEGNISDIDGDWAWADSTYTYTPDTPYEPLDTLVLTASAYDINGNSANASSSFTVKGDEIPPSVVSSVPADGEIDAPTNEAIAITFTNDIAPDSTYVTVTSRKKGAIPVTRSWVDNTVNLSHATAFAPGDTVTVEVNMIDHYDNRKTESWSFFVRTDVTGPSISLNYPGSADKLSNMAAIAITFSDDTDKSTVSVDFTGVTSVIDGDWVWDDFTYTFTPTTAYAALDSLTLVVSATDIHKNSRTLVTPFKIKGDEIAPSLLSRSPGPDEVNVLPGSPVIISFSSDISPDATQFVIKGNEQNSIEFEAEWEDNTVTLRHEEDFNLGEYIFVSALMQDEWENNATEVWHFVVREELSAPEISFVYSGSANNLSKNATIRWNFPTMWTPRHFQVF